MVYFGVFFVLPDSVRFHPIYAKIPDLCWYPFSVFVPPYAVYFRHPWVARVQYAIKEGGGMWGLEIKRNNFAWVGMEIFWHAIYFANPNTEPESQYLSLSCKGFGRRDLHIIQEYDLATAIEIRPLTQTHTCEMGSSIFLPWFDSNSRVRLGITFQACFWQI